MGDDRTDEDLAALLNLGLNLGDIERLWRRHREVGMTAVRAQAGRLLARGDSLSVTRQVSVGLELLQGPEGGACDGVMRQLIEALRIELDDPPERFRDPVMLTLIDEPAVLSSGHVFDRSTVYDERGAFRFQRCPMTREQLVPRAYPLATLKAELIAYKLHRLDGILAAVQASVDPPSPAAPPADAAADAEAAIAAVTPRRQVSTGAAQARLKLLDLARALLRSLRGAAGAHERQALAYFRLRLRLCDDVRTWPPIVEEMVGIAQPPRTEHATELGALITQTRDAIRGEVDALLRCGRDEEAAALTAEYLGGKRPAPMGSGEVAEWLARIDGAVSRAQSGAALGAPAYSSALGNWGRAMSRLPPPPEDESAALSYWTVTLRVMDAAGLKGEAVGELARALRTAASGDEAGEPIGYAVAGAGSARANGTYDRRGEYGGAALFVHSEQHDEVDQLWLLRYRMPSGNHWWYVAAKDQLDSDDGDLYRVRSDADLPPADGWVLAKDGQPAPPSLTPILAPPLPRGAHAPLRALLDAHAAGYEAEIARAEARADEAMPVVIGAHAGVPIVTGELIGEPTA